MLALFLSLCACGKQGGAPADERVQQYWDTLDGAQFQVKILSNLGQATLAYTLDYVYNCNSNDSFTITAPEALAGIAASITGDVAPALTLQYDNTVLDAPGPSRAGLTPADAVPYLLSELRTASPTEIWTEQEGGETLTVLKYVREEDEGDTMRQLWLRGEEPVRAQIYAEGECVMTCTFSEWTKKQ